MKFDVAKCFPSLPWWALFGEMAETGLSPTVIKCLRTFKPASSSGSDTAKWIGKWTRANGLAQGCLLHSRCVSRWMMATWRPAVLRTTFAFWLRPWPRSVVISFGASS